MIDKAMWAALWELYPVDMAFLCVVAVLCVALGAILIPTAAHVFILGDVGEEDELWEN